MAHPTCRQAYAKYAYKHTKESPIIQRRQTILFSDPMLKEWVKNNNAVRERVADQQEGVVARSIANISKWCKSGMLHLCHATISFSREEMLNAYQGELGTRHSEKQHCPAQLLATPKTAKGSVGDTLPSVLVPDSPLTRRGDIRAQSIISIEFKKKWGNFQKIWIAFWPLLSSYLEKAKSSSHWCQWSLSRNKICILTYGVVTSEFGHFHQTTCMNCTFLHWGWKCKKVQSFYCCIIEHCFVF